MDNSLLLLNLYFAANVIAFLSISAFSWLYLDVYLKNHKKFDLFRSLGMIFIGISFLLSLILDAYVKIDFDIRYLLLFIIQCIGLCFVLLSYIIEPIIEKSDKIGKIKSTPTLNSHKVNIYSLFKQRKLYQDDAKLKKEKQKKIISLNSINPLIGLVLAPINFILSLIIIYQIVRKIKVGLSVEFKGLLYFWICLSIFLLFEFISYFGSKIFVWVEVLTRDYSLLWIIAYVFLMVAAILLIRWILVFISFRVFANLFLSIWQMIIFLGVILTVVYSFFLIQVSEGQVYNLLEKNASLVKNNLSQIESNNIDLIRIMTLNSSFVTSLSYKDRVNIQKYIENISNNNDNLDRILISDNNAVIIYDSDRPLLMGESLSNNLILKKSILSRTVISGYESVASSASANSMVLQVSMPVLNKNSEFVGSITIQKRLNDNYLDSLKKMTNQEVLVYVNNKRSASTMLLGDEVSRVENLELSDSIKINKDDNTIKYTKLRILTIPYYVSYWNIYTLDDNQVGTIAVGTEQSVLVSIWQKALYNTFVISIILIIFATIPSYFLAKRLKTNLSA